MPELRHEDLTVRVDETRGRWPAARPAVGVVRAGSPGTLRAAGLADIASKTPVTTTRTR